MLNIYRSIIPLFSPETVFPFRTGPKEESINPIPKKLVK